MSAQYQRLLKLLEKWPIDKTKSGRDLGEHLQKQAQSIVNPANVTIDISKKLNIQIESLERLANNIYGKRFERVSTSTATGLNAQQCNQVLSSEFLEYLNEDRSFFRRKK